VCRNVSLSVKCHCLHRGFYNVQKVCLSACLLVICHTPLAPSVLNSRRPRPWRLSPWNLDMCPHLFHGQPEGVELPGDGVDLPIGRELCYFE